MAETPHLKLPMLEAGQAQKHVTVNEALEALDAVIQLSVLDAHRTAPPGAPEEGDRHIVAAGATGLWAGWEGHVALWRDGAWRFLAPATGWSAYVAAGGAALRWTGTAWVEGLARLSVAGAATSDTNRLAVASPAALFDNAGAGVQIKANKAGSGDTASVLLQTGHSGRAEIGLVGDDRLSLKQSADGATWRDALVVQDGGRVRAPRKPMAHAYLTSAALFVPGGGVVTVVPFDAAMLDGTGDFSIATGRFICPAAGRYRVEAELLVVSMASPTASLHGFVLRNGANALPGSMRCGFARGATGASTMTCVVSMLVSCQASDYLEVALSATADMTVFNGDITRLSIEYLG